MRSIPSRPTRGLGNHYLSRLERLVRLRRDFENHLNELGVDILDRSIYATYRDCCDNGCAEGARALMASLPGGGVEWQQWPRR
ncbi:MAG TPA: hypothetical protein VH951_09440 [Dehalococcoidia bacterium]|jgi:hypothetical protein